MHYRLTWTQLIERNKPNVLRDELIGAGRVENIDQLHRFASLNNAELSLVGYCVKFGRPRCLRVLLGMGASPDAVCRGMRRIYRSSSGRKVNIPKVPLEYAISKGCVESVEVLLEFGAHCPATLERNPGLNSKTYFGPEVHCKLEKATKIVVLLNDPLKRAPKDYHTKNAVVTFLLCYKTGAMGLHKDLAKKVAQMVWETRKEGCWIIGK
jgi:hypothetical protein